MSREITIVTPEHVELTFELAGIGSRFIAMLLDTLLLVLATIVIVLAAIGTTNIEKQINSPQTWVIAVLIFILFSLWQGYFLFFESTRNGQTPGKKTAGIRVIRDTGHPLDFRSALLRNVMRAVDGLPGIYGVGFVSIFLSPQYRRLGDYVAGTLVVKTQVKQAPVTMPTPEDIPNVSDDESPTEMQTASLLPQEALPYFNKITRDDYRAMRHFLDRKNDLDGNIADALARKIAAPLALKLQLDPEQIEDPAAFLESISREWERRMVH